MGGNIAEPKLRRKSVGGQASCGNDQRPPGTGEVIRYGFALALGTPGLCAGFALCAGMGPSCQLVPIIIADGASRSGDGSSSKRLPADPSRCEIYGQRLPETCQR